MLMVTRYTVSFTRTATAGPLLVLSGKLSIQNDGQESVNITQPNMTITSTGVGNSGTRIALPSGTVRCPELTVPALDVLTCLFTATYRGRYPTAGLVKATVTVLATRDTDGTLSRKVPSEAVAFDFTDTEMVTVGETATVWNWFARGEGQYIQPDSVAGQQPDGLLIGDSRAFNLVAFFSSKRMDSNTCGKTLQVGHACI